MKFLLLHTWRQMFFPCTSYLAPIFKIGRKHKAHRQQVEESKPWRKSEKGRKGDKSSKEKGRGRGKNRKMGQEESRMVDENTPPETLESRSLEAIAKYIKDGRAKRIVVMTGAGISTSAGIPDFRSPDTGLYANLQRLDLPYAEAVFDINYFRKNPLPFYTLAQELYPGSYRPTITHSFITLLYQKGLLLKLFTQNIDCLEREAGVPDDMIIEAHGSFARQCCIDCKASYPDDLMQKAIKEKSVPTCQKTECNGLVKPEIVFFGEQLPNSFFRNRFLPEDADLCIVMGTSLTVQPFASLPQACRDRTPRLLINSEQVGLLGSRADDVLLLEDCDTGVRKLAEACGWLEELESLWAMTAAGKPQIKKEKVEEPKKTRDERLADEVDKLTQEVEKSLKLHKEQHEWLANHIDNKFARIQLDENPKTPSVGPLHTSKDSAPKSVSDGSKTNLGGGLQHVFPWIDKKSSL
ncbi:NAD-dependent deacetylase sirtuin-2 [Periconia macrospinosa]|uniref:NAD-dependent deacetylase sirtuin-2 n=1 Tax=Periconia macrospinosa TaxID=97972 RepID=A0A2V1D7W3_9PLEO|nr:NAD-dependent deacetylase sirtuin-2 [Periconia macrospinosa]